MNPAKGEASATRHCKGLDFKTTKAFEGRNTVESTTTTADRQATAPALAHDLLIEITPRGPTVFRGAAEQLRAEGLIPDGFTWPTGDASVSFPVGQFSCALSRCRPEGMHGPKSAWTSGDFWCLRRGLASQPVRGFQANEIFEATAAMLEAVKRATPWGEYVQKRAHRAKQDSRYWAFRQQLLGEPKRKPGRPYKNTTSTTQTQGAAA